MGGMNPPVEIPHQRTWIMFYLICFVAILWASFLLVTEQMVWLSYTLVTIAALIGIFTFVMTRELRTWIFLFLICFVALLWAVFMLNQGDLLWVSVFLVIVSAGIGIFAYFLSEDHLEEKPAKKDDSSI
jgi:hypothetical protein